SGPSTKLWLTRYPAYGATTNVPLFVGLAMPRCAWTVAGASAAGMRASAAMAPQWYLLDIGSSRETVQADAYGSRERQGLRRPRKVPEVVVGQRMFNFSPGWSSSQRPIRGTDRRHTSGALAR